MRRPHTNAVPLNVLQKLFRSWESVHPYNAAQAVQLGETPSRAIVERAWNRALSALQLGPTLVNCHTLSRIAPDALGNIATPQVMTPAVSLQEHLSNELNRPFADEAASWPFRPFIVRDNGNTWIGLTYRHCVADSISIRLVLREWLAGLQCVPTPNCRAVHHAEDSYWDMFIARDGRVRLDETISNFLRGHQRLRSAQKPMTSGAEDYPVRVALATAPVGLIDELRHRCRVRRTRMSDVMLAALLETARAHVPLQLRRNRRDVAVGCIVDLRPYAARKLSQTFGLFLGFTSIVCSPKDFSSRAGLLEKVRRQTAMQRERGIAPSCTAWVTTGLLFGRFMPHSRLYHFYRKSMPLAAGLSSVRVRPEDSLGPQVLDYLRISPTGPIAPAVLSTTEMNGRLSLALTYRPAVLREESAQAILTDFVKALCVS